MKKKLSDVCKFQYGYPFDSSLFSATNGTPVVRIRDIIRGFSETKTIETCGTDYIINNGDILIGMDGEFNIAKWNGGKALLNQRVCKLIPIDINSDYIFYYLPKILKDIEEKTSFATVKHLSAKQLNSIYIDIPDINIQHKISNIFIKIDCIINKRKQQISKLDQLVKSRFVEMFGTYPSNHLGWETGAIRDVVSDIRYGSSRPAVAGGKYPYLRMNNITYDGELDLSDIKYIDIPDSELNRCTVRRGDVLFNRTNSKELVGKTCVYDRNELMVLAGFVIRIRVNERILPEFLSVFLNTDFSKKMLLGMCKTAIGQANINAKEIQNIGIYIPPIELQRQFVHLKKQVDKAKSFVKQSLETLETLKKSLIQEYFG